MELSTDHKSTHVHRSYIQTCTNVTYLATFARRIERLDDVGQANDGIVTKFIRGNVRQPEETCQFRVRYAYLW